MKEDVLDSLPKKTINLVPMEMPFVQEQAYSDAITKAGGTGKSRFEALSNIRSISPIHYIQVHMKVKLILINQLD